MDNLVFSKDRALQLHAFLESYKRFVTANGPLYVLYRASNAEHAQSYRALRELYGEKEILFIEEEDFKKQLVDWVKARNASKIALYVDDIIFTRPINYNEVQELDCLEYMIGPGRGEDLTYSVVLDKAEQVPTLHKHKDTDWVTFRWDESKEYNDWTFPLGVGGYVYDRNELLLMLSNLNYKAPNSLEVAMQVYNPYFLNRKGMCKQKTVFVGVHANVVQDEVKSRVVSDFTADELLKKWQQGLAIDVSAYAGKGAVEAQVQLYSFIPRK
jgi:hypothetical protein